MKRLFKKLRSKFFTYLVKRKCNQFELPLRVNGYTDITKNTILGRNVNFNGMNISGDGKVSIGDNFHSGRYCRILTNNHNYNGGNSIPYDNTYVIKDVVIKDNVWIGERVMILPGVTIGEGCIIQAGSVVVSDIPDFAIAGGHPAKAFSNRDIEHYQILKQEGKFH